MSSFYTRPVTMLPGGIPYVDNRVPQKRFPGMEVSSEDEQLNKIITWRKQNPAVYPPSEDGGKYLDKEWVRHNQLRPYQRQRLGDSIQYFLDGKNSNIGMEIKVKGPSKSCECGATDASPIYCKTCSSSRITGYKCNNCGKVRGL